MNTQRLIFSKKCILTSFYYLLFLPMFFAQENVETMEVTPSNPSHWAIALKGGSLGPGLEIAKTLGTNLTLRLGGTYLPANWQYSNVSIDADLVVEAKAKTANLFFDWYPSDNIKNKFHISFGGIYNNSEVTIDVELDDTEYQLNNRNLSKEEIGSLRLRLQPIKFQPYFGLGYGRVAGTRKRVSFNFDLGLVYQGTPKVQLTATGMIEPTGEQKHIIERNLKPYYLFPYAVIQISFNF